MRTLNLKTIISLDYGKGKQLLDVLTNGASYAWKRAEVYKHLKKKDYQLERLSPETVEFLVESANRMVKDANCPHNQFNRFYKWKHKYIKRQIQTGNVVEVYESEKHYRFVLKSGISFHQLKNSFPNGVPYGTKYEAYEPKSSNIPYDEETVNNAILQIALQDCNPGNEG